MASPILLPTPLPSGSLQLNQLLTDPLNPFSSASFLHKSPSASKPATQSDPQYRSIISQDESGHLLSSISSSHRQNLLVLKADNMTLQTLEDPISTFNALRTDTSAQKFILDMAHKNQPLYYVVGLQSLQNPTRSKARIQVPSSRRDSKADISEGIFGVVVHKVKCLVGPPNEPHSLEDIPLQWSYHKLEQEEEDPLEELQLSIGLGEPLSARELREMAGIVSEEDDDESTKGTHKTEDSEDDGSGY
ncbi:hypothetical protein GQ43DRAFT_410366 [Delitschia confertaspora ATCC 74209]|uniref:Uncharacterized protein n=1 Tax=Delitschia confertaspora ATCC 74209 TaxID=1513339 RepID=A0A9P4JT89_9PLEO|nr:hypothetical protein GQ43DRAFT_410366 [Delitschia confertaspora ATCC 74209]